MAATVTVAMDWRSLPSRQQLRGEPVGVEAAEPVYSSLLSSMYRRHPRAARTDNPEYRVMTDHERARTEIAPPAGEPCSRDPPVTLRRALLLYTDG